MRSVGSFDDAIALVSNYPPHEKFLNSISRLIQNGLETGDALGRGLIIAKDAYYSHKASQFPERTVIGKKVLSYAATQWIECDNSVKLSYSIIPEEALKILRERALTISGIEQQELLDNIKSALVDAVNSHETWTEFNKKVNALFDSFGVTDMHSGHLQTVFRTNLASAYSQGQLSQVLAMPDRFPMWQYSAIHDYRTRPSHMALDGNVYRVGEGPLPPIDYNCRCSAIYLHVYDTTTRPLAPQLFTSDPMVRFDNYTGFSSWLRSQKITLSPALRGWIEARSN